MVAENGGRPRRFNFFNESQQKRTGQVPQELQSRHRSLFFNLQTPRPSFFILHKTSAAKVQSSFPANDILTKRSATNGGISSASASTNSHAQQHLNNHNASWGRSPPNATSDLPQICSQERVQNPTAWNRECQSPRQKSSLETSKFAPSVLMIQRAGTK
jgi:hypothetical protein